MNTTVRDILWWLPMWTLMGVGGYYFARKANELTQKQVRFCFITMVALYLLWPVLGGVIFTYG